jgi:hypothetical protein
MRALRLPVGLTTLALLAALAVVPATAGASPSASAESTSSVSSASSARAAGKLWAPPAGALLSNPQSKNRRVILARVITTINHARAGSAVRIAVWNFDDYPVRRALIAADKRGVHVQVVVAGSVQNPNWFALAKQLNKSGKDSSWARKCSGGCRSRAKIMHSKVFLFSQIGRVKNISMYGSANLTTPAGNRQWNDMFTSYSGALDRVFDRTFREYALDRPVSPAYRRTVLSNIVVWLWPTQTNTILSELKRVSCRGATNTPNGRTKIRIAIAGWFDAFGNDIARRVRYLWDKGCNIRIVTTLAGRGVNSILKAKRGRGPVPIDRIGTDPNKDGVPDKYLHMKAIAIKGVFSGVRNNRVLITGSPNWSTRASRSEEVLVRWGNANVRVVDAYIRHVDNLYTGPWSYARASVPQGRSAPGAGATTGVDPLLRRYTAPGAVDAPALPEWFELE